MPLFFFLSGLVFNENKYDDIRIFLKNRFNSLIIPYVFFYLLTYLYWLFVERSFRSFDLSWWQPLLGMIQGSQAHGLMDHNGILWFLPCLFMTELLFVLVNKISNRVTQYLVLIVLVVIGFSTKEILPWCLNIAMVVLIFFWFANKTKIYVYVNRRVPIMVCGFILMGGAYTLLQYLTYNKVNISTCSYGNPAVFFISAFLGIIWVTLLCMMLSRIIGGGNKIGANTMLIFALHQPLLRILKYIGHKLFGNFPVENNIVLAVLVSIIIIIMLQPMVFFYNLLKRKYLIKLYINE